MKMNQINLALATLSLLCSTQAQAVKLQLLDKQAQDLQPATLQAAPANPSLMAVAPQQREAVAVAWKVEGGKENTGLAAGTSSAPGVQPFVAQSREAYILVSGAQLKQGVALETTSPRALVRLQALGQNSLRSGRAIDPRSLQLKSADGRSFAGGNGMQAIVDADKMAKADLPFAPGTSTFRIHPDLGHGRFLLQHSEAAADEQYMLNLVDSDSPYALHLQARDLNYLHGQSITLQASLQHGAVRHALQAARAELVAPDGRSFPLNFKANAGQHQAQLSLPANHASTVPGLWEVRLHAHANVKGQTIQRSVSLAVPLAVPVAKLDGTAQLRQKNGELQVGLGVQAASSGRYEVRGVLYGTVNGSLQPLAVGHSAQWVDAGTAELSLKFDQSLLQGASAPFEVRELALHDQSRFAVLHTRARGLVLDAADIKRAESEADSSFAAGNSGNEVKVHTFLPVDKQKKP